MSLGTPDDHHTIQHFSDSETEGEACERLNALPDPSLRLVFERPAMTRRRNLELWTTQWLLALLFLFAGGMKLVLPVAALSSQMPLPGPFLRFIGAAEVFGALGLILPGILGSQRWLTPLAAGGLVIIMAGATALTLATGGGAVAVIPLATGSLAGLVAVGRRTPARKKSLPGLSTRHRPVRHIRKEGEI
jgi:hypothetical protein